MQQSSYFDLVEYTQRNLFLTGKAGTGKTTFLQNFIKQTQKQYAIVAPTGIAAINAGGVTIHSFFGLPLTTFLPTVDYVDPNLAINIPQLLPHFKYRKDKLKLLRALEILIIDEVSMLRCDVLDMIDLALRTARRSKQPFGGVQLLLIGDLYQLPPVVKDNTERLLYSFYQTPFFFSAKSIENASLITITLEKIYRQSDPQFLHLLNAIRNRHLEEIDFSVLEERYNPSFEDDSYIHLVSHNYIAHKINQERLQELPGKTYYYPAIIEGEFKESQYPNDEKLALKEGTRVMFMRNDTSELKQYFNGMLATITSINEDEITVYTDERKESFTLSMEKWENKKYTTDSSGKIEEEVVGTFEQFPIKLAWAVTIHKSQGLTFDKVIIDAGQSFTSGQVYVALSRCRTLQGLVLKSRITPNAIYVNEEIKQFHIQTSPQEDLDQIVERDKYPYAIDRILKQLNPIKIEGTFNDLKELIRNNKVLDEKQINTITSSIPTQLEIIVDVFNKFQSFITKKIQHYVVERKNWGLIAEKSINAVDYFYEKTKSEIFEPLKEIYKTTKGTKGLKLVNDDLKDTLEELELYLLGFQKITLFGKKLLTVKTEETTINTKIEKTPSHIITFKHWEEGLNPNQIAEKRNLSIGTIYDHMAKLAAQGIIDIAKLFTQKQMDEFGTTYKTSKATKLSEWKEQLPHFEFHEIKIMLAHFNYQKNKEAK